MWNWDGRLRSGTKGDVSIALKYDPMGNRVFKDSNETGKRKYIVDIAGELPTILLELDPNDEMLIKKTYIYANGEILAQHDGNDSAPRYYYLHDRLGSVRQIINTNRNVVKYYTYEPFGKVLELGEADPNMKNPFMFTGQYFDSEIDEYYFRARMYDPLLGRFTSRDGIAGQFTRPLSLHKYLYCENEPINRIDPWGLYYELPGAGSVYNEEETQTVLDIAKGVVGADFTGGPIEAFIWSQAFGPGGMFDYKLSNYNFMRAGAKLSGSEFGNYLAGYATYYNYGNTGRLCTQFVGDMYELGKSGHLDDPGSRFYIASGALHAFREKGEKGLRGQLNEILLGYLFFDSLYDYSVSDVEGSDNALSYGYKFWFYDR